MHYFFNDHLVSLLKVGLQYSASYYLSFCHFGNQIVIMGALHQSSVGVFSCSLEMFRIFLGK